MPLSRSGLGSLLFVYLVWGSTFLAMRLAVGEQGFDPFVLAAIRTFFAGALLLALGKTQGHSLSLPMRELRWLLLTGVLLWVGGHTMLVWASRRIDSGLAALLFSSVPLWSILLTKASRTNRSKLVPALLGFLGVALVFPVSRDSFRATEMIDAGVVLLSAFFWAYGSLLEVDRRIPLAVASGYQLLFAGIVNAALSLGLAGEWQSPSGAAWLACLYLVVPGCVLAFLAYVHVLRTLSVSLAMSYAYVNPLTAVLLGVILLGESVTMRAGAGMLVVLGSVFWLFRKGEQGA
jgi:drug/metabolite transporter (DMT)-like permease